MIETPTSTTMHPASAIHNIDDIVPELVASPDGMSDGAFPSRAQSPVKTQFRDARAGEGLTSGTPFPLRLSEGQGPDEMQNGEAGVHSKEMKEEVGNEGRPEEGKSAVSGVRIAPSSPSASPVLSRRGSQTAIQINGKPIPSEPEALPSVSRSASPIRSRERSDSTSNTPTSAMGRSRRPSTLIPRPGKESETIPPRYANADTDALEEKPKADKDGNEEVLQGDTASDTKTDDDAEQQITERRPPPRVIVRDFGFTTTDPRFRGAFHPIPGEAEDEEDDEDARSTASGASSGWNRFAGRRKSSLGGGGWSGFGFGGFGFGGLSRRFSRSSRRGSQAGLSNAGGDDTESTRSGSRRGSVQVGAAEGKSPSLGGITLPPLGHDTDVSLADLTPSSTADDEPPFGRQYVFGAGAGALLKRGPSSGSRLRSSSSAGNDGPISDANQPTESDPRASILSQVSEEPHASESSPTSEAAKWPTDTTSNTTSSSGTTITPSEPRGRYKVLYEFTAESDHEMSVVEGEVLLVGGRWGNLGWVIAERVNVADGEAVVKGLVPEGYLGERIGSR